MKGVRERKCMNAPLSNKQQREPKKKELESLMQMITSQENTINLMRNSMRTTMPPFVNVDGSTESVRSVDSNKNN